MAEDVDRHRAAVLSTIAPLERQGGQFAIVAGALRGMVNALFAGPPPEQPATEAEIEAVDEKPEDGGAEPGSTQDASQEAFDATTAAEAKAADPLAA